MPIFGQPNTTYEFRFVGKRVTVNGIAQDFLGLCYILGTIDYRKAIEVIKSKPDYKQLSHELHHSLCTKQFKNITILQ